MDISLVTNALYLKGMLFYILLLSLFSGISVRSIKTYYMNDYCRTRLNLVSEKIFQFKLILYPVDIYDFGQMFCDMKMETWYNSYNKLMFYFEELNLDCSAGYLEFYDFKERDTRVIGLQKNICGNVKPEGIYKVDTRFLKIRYISSRYQLSSSVFSIIVTAFRDDSCPSYAHECDNSRCISRDLACNGFNSCGDNSSCRLSTATIVGIVIGSVIGLLFIVVLIVCCIYRQRRRRKNIQNFNSVFNTSQSAETYNGITLTSYSHQINRQTNIEGDTDPRENRGHYSQNVEIEEDDGPPPSYTVLFGNDPIPVQETNVANSDANNRNSQQILNSQIENISPNSQDAPNSSDATLPSYSDLFETN